MKSWLIKARHTNATILGEDCHPDEGWFFILDIPLSEISSKDFHIKKPKNDMGCECPRCGYPMFGLSANAIFTGCGFCGYEVEWVYAKYRIVWKD